MKMIIKLFSVLAVAILSACSGGTSDSSSNTFVVGTIAGPETELMEVAKEVAAQQYGLEVEIVEFEDYLTPNLALNDGLLDANAVVTKAYFDEVVQNANLEIVAIADTFTYPFGLYSSQIEAIDALSDGAQIAISNDPSNNSRGLLLLQDAGLIALDPQKGVHVGIDDITENALNLRLIELDSAQLPRALDDVQAAVINTNYAVPAGLSPSQDALFVEGKDSPYINIIAVREENINNPLVEDFIKAFQSDEVIAKAQALFQDQAIPAWLLSSEQG